MQSYTPYRLPAAAFRMPSALLLAGSHLPCLAVADCILLSFIGFHATYHNKSCRSCQSGGWKPSDHLGLARRGNHADNDEYDRIDAKGKETGIDMDRTESDGVHLAQDEEKYQEFADNQAADGTEFAGFLLEQAEDDDREELGNAGIARKQQID